MKLFSLASQIVVLSLLLLSPAASAEDAAEPEPTPAPTADNLQAACAGLAGTQLRYLAMAKQADSEGQLGVGSLFHAAARSHEVNAGNCTAELKRLGLSPLSAQDQPVVKSTIENLKTALDTESYERDRMYPDFRKKAEEDGNKEAARVFDYAARAAEERANFFVSAMARPDQWQKTKKEFFVCPTCGRMTRSMPVEKCSVCSGEPNKLQRID